MKLTERINQAYSIVAAKNGFDHKPLKGSDNYHEISREGFPFQLAFFQNPEINYYIFSMDIETEKFRDLEDFVSQAKLAEGLNAHLRGKGYAGHEDSDRGALTQFYWVPIESGEDLSAINKFLGEVDRYLKQNEKNA